MLRVIGSGTGRSREEEDDRGQQVEQEMEVLAAFISCGGFRKAAACDRWHGPEPIAGREYVNSYVFILQQWRGYALKPERIIIWIPHSPKRESGWGGDSRPAGSACAACHFVRRE